MNFITKVFACLLFLYKCSINIILYIFLFLNIFDLIILELNKQELVKIIEHL